MAKLADARDSKSRGAHAPCGFDPHLRHHILEHSHAKQERTAESFTTTTNDLRRKESRVDRVAQEKLADQANQEVEARPRQGSR